MKCSNLVLVGCAVALLGGCAVQQSESGGTLGLTLTERTEVRIAGEYALPDSVVSFESERITEHAARVHFAWADASYDYLVDADRGTLELDGHGHATTQEDLDLLLGALADLEANLEGTDMRFQDKALWAALNFVSDAPLGYVQEHTFVDVPRFGDSAEDLPEVAGPSGDTAFSYENDGVQCVYRGRTYTAYYDHDPYLSCSWSGCHLRTHYWAGPVSVNTQNDCMGRCGAGCSGFSVSNNWSRDCMEHDKCGRDQGGSTNPLDTDCGDEYGHAADDFAAFWIHCDG